jgi:hypothetical protein
VVVKIQRLTEQEEWVDFKDIHGDDDKDWNDAVKEVYQLNTNENDSKYRAVFVNGFLTHIYCSGFYIVPTIRGW